MFRNALAFETEEAKTANALGYMARLLVQVTMPHSKPVHNEFERQNGNVAVRMVAPSKIGLPYGTYPRLLMAWVTKEAVLKGGRTLELGDSLSGFMRDLGLNPTGGRWGSIARLQDHLGRLVTSSISYTYEAKGAWMTAALHPVESAGLWWDPKSPEQRDLWKSCLILNQRFFEEITRSPVPYDQRVLRKLARTRSPLAMDIYFWLTHRLSYLKKPARIPWTYLEAQFGGEYKRTSDFRAAFVKQMAKVQAHYPVRCEAREDVFMLWPGRPSIPKLVELPG